MRKKVHEVKRLNSPGKTGNLSFDLVIGSAAGLITTAVLSAVEACLADKGILAVELATGMSVLVWCLAGLICGYIGAKRAGSRLAVRGLIAGAIYAGALLLITGAGCGARIGNAAKGFAIILASSLVGGILVSVQLGNRCRNRHFR